ncbi:MAG TPA: hypothetical protein VGN55_02910 [Xanthobacteraceae bacterium]|jgi:hypothetical protein
MFGKMKIALSAALILGTASVALAGNDIDESVSEAQATREMHGNPLPWWWNAPVQGRGSFAQAGSAYGYSASPTQPEDHPRKKGRNH